MKRVTWLNLLVVVFLMTQLLLAASAGAAAPAPTPLRLATTTSTADSGLLDFILPDFEKANNAKVEVVAVGTGQALEIGTKGDADVLLVHNRKGEDKFVADKDAKQRFDVMYNDFIIVGPKADPAKIAGMKTAKDAFKVIADSKSPFASRGDKSGTNSKELSIWATTGITPTKESGWYNALGQGMGETLLFSNEQKAYTLTDRGTYLAMQDKLPDLSVLMGGKTLAENKDSSLLNPYGVMAVNPDKHPGVNSELAQKFVDWILSADMQKKIGSYGADKFGQSLFYPSSDEYKATREVTVKNGDKSKTFTLADLQALPKQTIKDIEFTGHKKGPLGKNTWAGASLKDVLLGADPTLSDAKNADKIIVATASDGWVSKLRWSELFGKPAGGQALADSYGCSECHGMYGEGTAPQGKTPVSALAGKDWDLAKVTMVLRTGKPLHGELNAFTPEQLSDAEIAAIMGWFKDTKAPPTGFEVDPAKLLVLLAYEKDGKPMKGSDGLLQMVDGMDKYTSRFAHWVKNIEVK